MSELQDLITLPHIWQSMQRVEQRLIEVSTSEHHQLTEIAQHLLLAGGKRYRPLVALLAAEFGPEQDHRAVEAGVAVELIHVGSLYHDDVIDESDTRRGATSANTNWSNTVAILAGDFLMARASETAATHLDLESVRLLAATYAELVEGQTREMALDFDLNHDLAAYDKVIEQKTASLIRTSARLGARASNAPTDVVEAISSWAHEVGMVFQIADDALDLVSTTADIGKPAGSDIAEGKFTMPVLLGLTGPDGSRIKELLEQPRPYDRDSINEVIGLVRRGGFVDVALDAAAQRLIRAEQAVAGLPAVPAKAVLADLGQYLVDRVAVVRS